MQKHGVFMISDIALLVRITGMVELPAGLYHTADVDFLELTNEELVPDAEGILRWPAGFVPRWRLLGSIRGSLSRLTEDPLLEAAQEALEDALVNIYDYSGLADRLDPDGGACFPADDDGQFEFTRVYKCSPAL